MENAARSGGTNSTLLSLLRVFRHCKTNVNILHMNLRCSYFVSLVRDLTCVKPRGDPWWGDLNGNGDPAVPRATEPQQSEILGQNQDSVQTGT